MFYTFDQNNSGGSFDYDKEEGISVYVIVEALNAEEANTKATNIGLYFNGCDSERDCSCCGDRWNKVDSHNGGEKPAIYGKTDFDDKTIFAPKSMEKGFEAFVHYADGRIKGFGEGEL